MGAWSWFGSDSTEDPAEPSSDALAAPVFPASAADAGAAGAGAAAAGAAGAGAAGAWLLAAGALSEAPVSLLVAVSPAWAARGTSPSRAFGTWFAVFPVASSGVAGFGVPYTVPVFGSR
ncbi:hypothetical protein DEI84_02785 [Curtobacterium sp. MCBD17_023]|nr:hypothetical protein DEI84_02785 [Curtobacterium sp. MCBD17_023]